jgi:hypothetical protein
MENPGRLGGDAVRERQEQRCDGQGAKHQAIVSPRPVEVNGAGGFVLGVGGNE